MALLLLLIGCTEYQVKGPEAETPDSPVDSVSCAACTLEGQPAGTVPADATCNHIDAVIANPFELAAGPELFANADWSESYGGMAAVVADFDADGASEIAVIDLGEIEGGWEDGLAIFDVTGAMSATVDAVWTWSAVAAVDLDGADGADLLVYSCLDYPTCYDRQVTLRSPAGEILWGSQYDSAVEAEVAPLVCDLRSDGTPEVIAQGNILDGATGRQTGAYPLDTRDYPSACADIDHDGSLEFAVSGTLFSGDGVPLWSIWRHAGDDGGAYAMQADADREPEFLFVSGGLSAGFTVADTDGAVLSEVSIQVQNLDTPVVTDVDGDGSTDIALVTLDWTVVAYDLDGTLLWERDDLGYITTMSGWDLDGDGASELLVQEMPGVSSGEYAFKILDGATGDVLYSTPSQTYGGWPPIVADLDNDGHAEIVVAGGAPRDGLLPSATIYHQVDNTWPAAGPAWPVPDYHLTNVGPAGEIPRGEPDPPSWMYNVVHARPAVDGQGVNLTPTVAQVCTDTCQDTVQLDVVVTNSGPMPASDVVVRVYAGSTILTDVAIGRVGSGEVSEGMIVTLAASDFGRGEIRLVVDPDDASPECDEGDNEVVLADPR